MIVVGGEGSFLEAKVWWRVICVFCRRRASSQRHQSSLSVLLLFARRRLRSSRDESFVGCTLSRFAMFTVSLPLPRHGITPISIFFFFYYIYIYIYVSFGPLERNGATAANPGISDPWTPRNIFLLHRNDIHTYLISIFQTYTQAYIFAILRMNS